MQGVLSYPFFDPVLTDRAFLASPKAMLISFLLAGLISGTFIFLFAFMGIFGNMVAVLQPYTYALKWCCIDAVLHNVLCQALVLLGSCSVEACEAHCSVPVPNLCWEVSLALPYLAPCSGLPCPVPAPAPPCPIPSRPGPPCPALPYPSLWPSNCVHQTALNAPDINL